VSFLRNRNATVPNLRTQQETRTMNAQNAARRFHPDVAIADTDAVRDEIYRFRYEVFYEECGRDAPGTDHDARMIRDKGGENTVLLYVRKEGRIVGTVRVDLPGSGPIPDHVRDWFGIEQFAEFPNEALGFSYQIMVAPEWRGSPVLGHLVKACYQLARENGLKFAFCGASPHLVKLYEAMGFRRYKDNIHVEGHGYQMPFVCVVEDVEHLAAVRSPFLKIASRYENSPETREWFLANFPQSPGYACERLLHPDQIWDFVQSRLPQREPALLKGLTDEEKRRILGSGTILRCKAQDVVMHQGQRAGDMALILSGVVEVRRRFEHGEYPVSCLGSGEVIGAMSYGDEMPRSADVVALTPLEIVVLTPSVVERAVRGNEVAKRKLMSNRNQVVQEHLRAWADALSRVQQAA
jgi:GNAT superfamily N-acetyltransferase